MKHFSNVMVLSIKFLNVDVGHIENNSLPGAVCLDDSILTFHC